MASTPSEWRNADYCIEVQLACLAIETVEIVDYDIVKCVEYLLNVSAGRPPCNDNSFECDISMLAYDLLYLIDIDINDVILNILRVYVGEDICETQ